MKGQRKRRKERLKDRSGYQPDLFELIDGNKTHYPKGYCRRYGGYLSSGLMETHRCLERNCVRYEAEIYKYS